MVNILDVNIDDLLEEFKKSGKDRLQFLFELQRELCKKADPELLKGDIYTKEGQDKVKQYIFYCAEELFELSNKMKARPWVKTIYLPDVNEIYDEHGASMMGLFENTVTVLIHTGSRGLGYQGNCHRCCHLR